MSSGMDNMFVVKDIVDRMVLSGDIRPLLEGLAEDVVFTLVTPSSRDTRRGAGKAAVREYFETLGDLVTFWRANYSLSGARVVVQVEESFTIQPGGLAADGECTLLFDLRDGVITRLFVEESPATAHPHLDLTHSSMLPSS